MIAMKQDYDTCVQSNLNFNLEYKVPVDQQKITAEITRQLQRDQTFHDHKTRVHQPKRQELDGLKKTLADIQTQDIDIQKDTSQVNSDTICAQTKLTENLTNYESTSLKLKDQSE